MRIELVLLSLKLYYIEYMDIAKDSDRFIQNIQQLTLVNIIPTLTFLQINPPEIKPNNKQNKLKPLNSVLTASPTKLRYLVECFRFYEIK